MKIFFPLAGIFLAGGLLLSDAASAARTDFNTASAVASNQRLVVSGVTFAVAVSERMRSAASVKLSKSSTSEPSLRA